MQGLPGILYLLSHGRLAEFPTLPRELSVWIGADVQDPGQGRSTGGKSLLMPGRPWCLQTAERKTGATIPLVTAFL